MAAQQFFYETPHANYACMLSDGDNCFLEDLKNKANLIDNSKTLYRVIAQKSSDGNSVQIFVAPNKRYSEIAKDMLEKFRATNRIYYMANSQRERVIRQADFVAKFKGIAVLPNSLAIPRAIKLIKQHFAAEVNRIENKIKVISKEYEMGTVEHQEYYSGLAETWISFS